MRPVITIVSPFAHWLPSCDPEKKECFSSQTGCKNNSISLLQGANTLINYVGESAAGTPWAAVA
jgi:hypothetical protein